MTSRERVITALVNKLPDRVPIDYLANPGIDGRLKKHFGLAQDDNEGLLQALNVDFRYVEAPYTGPCLHPEIPDRQVDPCLGIRTRWVVHESGGYWDFCDFPLQYASVDEVAAWPMPSPDNFDYSYVAEFCRKFQDKCVVMSFQPDVINTNGMVRTMEQTLVDLMTDDKAGLLFVDRRVELYLEVKRRSLEAVKAAGCGIDIVLLGEDLGTQSSPLISLDLFRRHIRPRHQPFIDLAKSYGAKVMMHSCGSSSWAFEDFIEMGVDVMDTLQPEAANMSPQYLKDTFGGRLGFHGCISTAGPVAYGTVQEVRDSCREILDIMMPGGEYCFAPTHQLQDNSPIENVLAMYETAIDYGKYCRFQ